MRIRVISWIVIWCSANTIHEKHESTRITNKGDVP